MHLYDSFDEINMQVQNLVNENTTEVAASDVGLDSRCWKILIADDCVVVPLNHDRTMQYYGGFEYVDADYRRVYGDYVFYFCEEEIEWDEDEDGKPIQIRKGRIDSIIETAKEKGLLDD